MTNSLALVATLSSLLLRSLEGEREEELELRWDCFLALSS